MAGLVGMDCKLGRSNARASMRRVRTRKLRRAVLFREDEGCSVSRNKRNNPGLIDIEDLTLKV